MSTQPPAAGRALERKTDGLSIAAAAEQLGVHPQTIRNWIRQGRLGVTKFGPSGGIIRIHPDDVAELRHPPPERAT